MPLIYGGQGQSASACGFRDAAFVLNVQHRSQEWRRLVAARPYCEPKMLSPQVITLGSVISADSHISTEALFLPLSVNI